MSQMMEIEIKFAKGKLDYVNVHHGDEPLALAKVNKFQSTFPKKFKFHTLQEFVAKHNLKPASIQIIAQYIEQTIADYLRDHPEEEFDDDNNNTADQGTRESSEGKFSAESGKMLTVHIFFLTFFNFSFQT